MAAHQHPNGGGTVDDTACVHATAYVGECASVGAGASVGYCASVGAGASVGERARVGAGASVGYAVRIPAKAKWVTSPPQVHLPHTILAVVAPNIIASGCVSMSFDECTDERICDECYRERYTPEAMEQYVRAARWLIEGVRSGALHGGEWVE